MIRLRKIALRLFYLTEGNLRIPTAEFTLLIGFISFISVIDLVIFQPFGLY